VKLASKAEKRARYWPPWAVYVNRISLASWWDALQKGWIVGTGLNGYNPEPLPKDGPLLVMDNVVVSSYWVAHMDEALLRIAMAVTDMLAVIEDRKPEYAVPPPA
jgi:phosphoglycerate dehydrogenase-like enzyme